MSEKEKLTTTVEGRVWATMAPEILEFLSEQRTVKFSNGNVETDVDVDAVMFCTGYFCSYPFSQSISPPVIIDVSSTKHLHEHVIYIEDPTLAFIGIPQRVVPFPISEAQAASAAQIWSNKLPLPSHRIQTWPTEKQRR